MTKNEFSFRSADGYSDIHAVNWLPDGEIRGIYQIVHGMVEYIERYTEFAEYLCSRGYIVVGHDHIGHGHSVKDESELGVMTGKHPSDIMVDDIMTLYTLTKKEYPELPYFIMGHSMGSYMLRKFLCVKGSELSGLSGAVIMGTGQEAAITINAGLTAIGVLSMFRGKNYRSTFVRDLTYSKPYKKFDCYGKDYSNSWLSKNIENVEKYYNDPLCTFTFTLNAYKGLVEATKYDRAKKHLTLMRKDLPVLFVSGEDDPVGNLGKGTEEAYISFKEAGVEDAAIKLYKNDRHEILNETDRAIVYEDILNWIESKIN